VPADSPPWLEPSAPAWPWLPDCSPELLEGEPGLPEEELELLEEELELELLEEELELLDELLLEGLLLLVDGGVELGVEGGWGVVGLLALGQPLNNRQAQPTPAIFSSAV
jgi:hypothetical protein